MNDEIIGQGRCFICGNITYSGNEFQCYCEILNKNPTAILPENTMPPIEERLSAIEAQLKYLTHIIEMNLPRGIGQEFKSPKPE